MSPMTEKLLKGKPIAEKLKIKIRTEVENCAKELKATPTLRAIQVGEDESSQLYLASQKRVAESCGIQHEVAILDQKTSEAGLIEEIQRANQSDTVHGIIVQMPLPKSFQVDRVLDAISPAKDVEAVTTSNLGRLVMNKEGLAPCTASACIRLIEETGVDLYGKEAVVIGSSKVVGLPAFLLLLGKKCTSMICHTGTAKVGALQGHVSRADIVVISAGRPGMIPGEWIKPGAIVIDVGINRVGGKTVGDVEFEGALARARFITPVPGGVGPLTTTMLMHNVVMAVQKQSKLKS